MSIFPPTARRYPIPRQPLSATHTDGRCETFPSIGAAARALGMPRQRIHRALAGMRAADGWQFSRIPE